MIFPHHPRGLVRRWLRVPDTESAGFFDADVDCGDQVPIARGENSPVGVAIVDSHPVVRSALANELGSSGLAHVVGVHDSAEQAIPTLVKHPPQLLVVELDLPGVSGLEVIRCAAQRLPSLTAVTLCHSDLPALRFFAERLGAHVVPSSNTNLRSLCRRLIALASAGAGGTTSKTCTPQRTLREEQHGSASSALRSMSWRELEVLRCIAQGFSIKQIGILLQVSPRTVEGYRARVAEKLGVGDRVLLARRAISEGLLAVRAGGKAARR